MATEGVFKENVGFKAGKKIYRSTNLRICGHTQEVVTGEHLRADHSGSCLHIEVKMVSRVQKVTTMYHTMYITKYTTKTSCKHVLMVVTLVHYIAISIPLVIGQQ